MYLGEEKNEYGTTVSKHKCDTCGEAYTLCPAVKKGDSYWEHCRATTCESYDPRGDLDVIFMDDKELSDTRSVVDIEMLAKRRKHRNGENVFEREEAK